MLCFTNALLGAIVFAVPTLMHSAKEQDIKGNTFVSLANPGKKGPAFQEANSSQQMLDLGTKRLPFVPVTHISRAVFVRPGAERRVAVCQFGAFLVPASRVPALLKNSLDAFFECSKWLCAGKIRGLKHERKRR